jgi:hypothetical protein
MIRKKLACQSLRDIDSARDRSLGDFNQRLPFLVHKRQYYKMVSQSAARYNYLNAYIQVYDQLGIEFK